MGAARVHQLPGGLGTSLHPAAAPTLPELLEINSNTTATMFIYGARLKFHSKVSKGLLIYLAQKKIRDLFPKTGFYNASRIPLPAALQQTRGQGARRAHPLTCEGVHEGGQRPIEHLEEGVSARVLLRATQDSVLQHVRDAGAVPGRGAELHTAATREKQVKAQADARVRPRQPCRSRPQSPPARQKITNSDSALTLGS